MGLHLEGMQMAKARRSAAKRSSKKSKRVTKAKLRAKTRKPKARRRGPAKGVVGMAQETAALRERLAGRNTFED